MLPGRFYRPLSMCRIVIRSGIPIRSPYAAPSVRLMAVIGVPVPFVFIPLKRPTLEQRHGAAATRISADDELRGKRLKGGLIRAGVAAQEIVAKKVAPLPVFHFDNP
jgi:hypothetical protein